MINNNMRNTILFFVLFSFMSNVHSQIKKQIKKGRRYESESQFALSKADFQAEWEFGTEKINAQTTTNIYPNLVLHYALSDRLEVNTEMSLIQTIDQSAAITQKSLGIEPILIGANYQLLRDTYNSPSLIISAQLAMPFTATQEFTIDYMAPFVQLHLQQAVHKKWLMGVSSGLQWDGFSSLPSFTYNASTSYTIRNKWMITGECFGFLNNEQPQHNIDVSMAYVINNLVQFGITAGKGISPASPVSYIAVNGSWGINTARKTHRH